MSCLLRGWCGTAGCLNPSPAPQVFPALPAHSSPSHSPAGPCRLLLPVERRGLWAGRDTGDISAVPDVRLACPSPPFPRRSSTSFVPSLPSLGRPPAPEGGLGPRPGTGRGWDKVGGSGGCGSSAPPSPRQLRARPGALPAGWQCYPASGARPRGPGKGGSNLSQMCVLSFPSLLCRWASCDVKSSEQSWLIFFCASWSCGQV